MINRYSFFCELERSILKHSSPGIRPGLERISILLDNLGNPQNSFNAVHIVGTNGKGSTSAFLSNIFLSAGYRTATYTSPHLRDLGERLVLDGNHISVEKWAQASSHVFRVIENDIILKEDPPSFFETLTAISFLLIKEANVDIAIIEAGMGGRLDATNMLGKVALSVITPIALDHSEFLGEDLMSIAREKLAVIRHNGMALFSGGDIKIENLFMDICMAKQCNGRILSNTVEYSNIKATINGTSFLPIIDGQQILGSLETKMLGLHQISNSALAAIAALELRQFFDNLNEEAIYKGIFNTRWPGRMEVISSDPIIMFDGAHNVHGIRSLLDSLMVVTSKSQRRKMVFVFTAMSDKEYRTGLSLLAQSGASIILTEVPDHPRCESATKLQKAAVSFEWAKKPLAIADPFEAIRTAVSDGEFIVICGSLYLIGLVREKIIATLS